MIDSRVNYSCISIIEKVKLLLKLYNEVVFKSIHISNYCKTSDGRLLQCYLEPPTDVNHGKGHNYQKTPYRHKQCGSWEGNLFNLIQFNT